MRELKIFSGQANRKLAKDICAHLHLPLGEITLGKFQDGENYCKIEEDIRGRDIFLIQPTCPPVNDNLLELLIMIDSCKRASAERITTVIPYFGYARQDRKDEGRVPITAKLVANLITRAGADRVLTMDLHSPQIQGFFDVPVDNMFAAPVLNDFV
ncbi:MAG: ribose-phosphate diphosphokinase, partial [Pirellulaceae bacterium]|nr:ribose-phosphate diphosphokinase [Pirellulaceae bacterium]